MANSETMLKEHLAGLDYPVSREDLIRWGQENGVSTEVMQLLRSLPGEQFESATELRDALAGLV